MTKKHHHSEHATPPPAEEANLPAVDPAHPTAEPVPAPPAAAPGPAAEPAPSAEEALRDRLLRLQADFENYRKRMDRERKDWISFASEKLILELLPVLDHFELGLADSARNGASAAFTEGFQLICNQLRAALEKAGVQAIAAEGQAFDPNLHEAITHLPSDQVPEGHVAAQTRRGYKLGDKLLRAAQVVVSSGPAA
jgi:molecular chaperone GrpE